METSAIIIPQNIISLTSYGERLKNINLVIDSLINQSVKADKIILWVAYEDEKLIPADLYDKPIEIRLCEDLKSYKKLIPALKEFPNDNIITVDDDIIYNNNLVKELLEEHNKNPDAIVGRVGRKITFNQNGNLKSYFEWPVFNYYSDKNVFLIGNGGILYPPNSLDETTLNKDRFMKEYSIADDIWFWLRAKLKKTKIICLGYKHVAHDPNIKNIEYNKTIWSVNKNKMNHFFENIKRKYYDIFNDSKKYYFTVCAIAKEEALYIDEWIAYHLLKGAEHFYIRYDDKAKDIKYARKILQKWIDKGVIEVEYCDTNAQQNLYYKNMTLNKIMKESQWCAYIDLDEFIWSKDNFVELLRKYENKVDSINLNWIFFGDNGNKTYDDRLLVERFTKHQDINKICHSEFFEIKTILNFNKNINELLYIKNFHFHIHTFTSYHKNINRLQGDLTIINNNDFLKSFIKFPLNIFGLAHFHCKTKEEFDNIKAKRTSAVRKINVDAHNLRHFYIKQRFDMKNRNEFKTHSLESYAEPIKKILSEYPKIKVPFDIYIKKDNVNKNTINLKTELHKRLKELELPKIEAELPKIIESPKTIVRKNRGLTSLPKYNVNPLKNEYQLKKRVMNRNH